ncbi:MAG: AIR synthase related protein, partial [Actinomycetota bacterium]
MIRTYDHEVLGGTIVRPYDGVEMDGPADGTVIVPPGTVHASPTGPLQGAVVGIGAAPLIGRHDCEAMAWSSVDEAIRNAVVAGADPSRLSLLDNFAWGNPTDPETLGRLVAACRGCHDAAVANGAPFVSGKDSLYNEFVHPDGTRDPVT